MSATPRIIVLLSGKGGSGKSTIAVSIAKILADIGKTCLLVDFDLSTNGVSYFFQEHLKDKDMGAWEVLEREESSQDINVNPILVEENLYFLPSRSRLRSKGPAYDDLSINEAVLKRKLLTPLQKQAEYLECDYVIIDCQAGYSISSSAAARCAHLAVIVTEADAISSDAADNLLIQLGDALPSERLHLVNKVDVRDAGTYRQMKRVFATLNRLPPLPFDFNVRAAFGARKLPVQTSKPSPLLFALFETLQSMMPELYEEFELYRSSRIDQLRQDHDKRFDQLTKFRDSLEMERAELEYRKNNLTRRLKYLVAQSIGFGSSFVAIGISFSIYYDFKQYTGEIVFSTLLLTLSVAMILGSFIYRKHTRHAGKIEEEMRIVSFRIRENEAELDQYRSLLWTQSQEYLLDDEIAHHKYQHDLAQSS